MCLRKRNQLSLTNLLLAIHIIQRLEACMDAKGKFKLNGTKRNCAYVKNNVAENLCGISKKVRNKCKVTCDTCPAGMKVNEAEEEDTEFECTLYHVQGLAVDNSTHAGHGNVMKAIKCVDEKHDHDSYSLEDIPEDFDISFQSGKTKLTVSNQAVTQDMEHGNVINLKDRIATFVHESQDERNRFIADREGIQSLLIVRVTFYNGGTLEQPSVTGDQISTQVFNNLSRYSTCSRGKLSFVPASGNGINGGVMTIKVNSNMSDMVWNDAEQLVTDFMNNIGIAWNTYDFTSYVFPESVNFGGNGGLAYIDYYLSMFWNSQIMYKYMILHELGHNLGHNHSGDNAGGEYADETGMMGVGHANGCFNAAKSWYFGWYADRAKSITPASSSWSGELVPVNDYLNGSIQSDQQVVVQVTGVGETDLYLMFNRVEGVIDGKASINDRVTVISQDQDKGYSHQLSSLGVNQEHRSNNWEGKGKGLVVKVCSVEVGSHPCNARVIAYIETGNNDPSCCIENIWAKFVTKSGDTKNCNWLANQKEKNMSSARNHCNRPGYGGLPPASETCCETCQFNWA